MAKICELKVTNRKNAMTVVANRILAAKATVLVPFYTLQQLEGVLAAERNERVKIETAIPKDVLVKYPQLKPTKVNIKKADEKKEEELANIEATTENIETIPTIIPTAEVVPNEDEGPGVVDDAAINTIAVNPEDSNVTPELTRQEIIDMTAKEMKAYIADHDDITIEGYSKLNARDLTETFLAFYDFEKLSDEEKA